MVFLNYQINAITSPPIPAFLASFFSSILETMIAQAASPVIFTVVRPISKIRSTPATFAGTIFISTEDGYTAFPKGKILVLYCDRGGASLLLARQLAKLGYCTRSVIGGFGAYRGRNLVISP